MAKLLDHVCILVKDIDKAIEHYKNIINACVPGTADQKVEKYEAFAGGDRYYSALFEAHGDGCSIQLMQPINPESALYKRLEKHGEHIHHLAFSPTKLGEILNRLRESGVTLRSDEPIFDASNPDVRWNWIMPQYAHGALIEVVGNIEE